MVQWDDKERGYPISEENGTRGMYLTCLDCKHSTQRTWAQILERWPVGTYTRDIARSLKCTRCRARKGHVMAWSHGPAGT